MKYHIFYKGDHAVTTEDIFDDQVELAEELTDTFGFDYAQQIDRWVTDAYIGEEFEDDDIYINIIE